MKKAILEILDDLVRFSLSDEEAADRIMELFRKSNSTCVSCYKMKLTRNLCLECIRKNNIK